MTSIPERVARLEEAVVTHSPENPPSGGATADRPVTAADVLAAARRAKVAARAVALLSTATKDAVLRAMAQALRTHTREHPRRQRR